ncbi:chaperonin GroEL [Paenibacillus popilliae ATCC 14706]|uniref:Chaperonin GroEL n=2 Tax=Paenibacillus popilliae TaxID=78057 RepID=M9M858_PAEPP|nr:chaperonin GroEL [Paenibacillus popilliae ATCC 14706]
MTVRELREVKKALKEAEARALKAEEDYELVRGTLESIEAQPQPEPIVIEKPVYQVCEVVPPNVQSRIDEVERRLEEAESERDEAKYDS